MAFSYVVVAAEVEPEGVVESPLGVEFAVVGTAGTVAATGTIAGTAVTGVADCTAGCAAALAACWLA